MKLKEKIYPCFTIPKINSSWITKLNVKAIKLVKDDTEEYPFDLGPGSFLKYDTKTITIKERLDWTSLK